MSKHRPHRLIGLSSIAALFILVPVVLPSAGASHNPPPPPEEEAAAEECTTKFQFDPTNFGPLSHQITNPWLPLTPGVQLVLEGEADRGSGIRNHRVIFTATSLTKVIGGVRVQVMWDLDISEDRLSEAELAFFAQDLNGGQASDPPPVGNVWSLGEYPEEYEEEIFQGAPSTWIHGIGDAEGGVHMKAVPVVSDEDYSQGIVPSIEFLDCAKVVSMDDAVCVPVGCHEPVLTTWEGGPGVDPADEDGVQTKHHAQGIGIVHINFINDPEGEVLDLVQRNLLTPSQLALVNREALRLEKRAYRVSGIYAQTQPMDPPRITPTVALRRFKASQDSTGAKRHARRGVLRGGKAKWCTKVIGQRLCKRWATTGTVLPGY